MGAKQIAIQTARWLRKNQTLAEKKFWSVVRNKQILGFKFLRQYPVYFEWENKTRFFIADFYCDSLKLVVEIDGGIHEQQKDYDILREKIIQSKNLRIVRINNENVLQKTNTVVLNLENIIREIQQNPPPSPPLSLQGRGAEGGES